jgi:hypothetical protein
MRTAGVIAGVLVMLTLWSAGSVFGASLSVHPAKGIVADVDGDPIKSVLISSMYCHDFDFPRIHCFRSAADLEASLAKRRRVAAAPSFGVNDYVTIFDGPNYSGSFMDVSQNYDVLFSIGWNDRISSYKARNSASGTFWTDWFASGTARNFCCNTNVSSLPGGLDNAFSSVYRH